NYLRTKRRSPGALDPAVDSIAELGPSPATLIDARHEQRLLLAALRSIPIEHQIVLELSYFEAMTRNEIADALGEPAGTIASRIRAARSLLDAALTRMATSTELLTSTTNGIERWVAGIRERLAAPPSRHS
ncbi:MAG TPA: sigma factor-like helix-turn-helix DNA-binding protein, partial [Nannocystaceae bacterium]|nr:sigma factor-like helix-turn-helix DNA-binding protein [Nannocystaceae bacterium]